MSLNKHPPGWKQCQDCDRIESEGKGCTQLGYKHLWQIGDPILDSNRVFSRRVESFENHEGHVAAVISPDVARKEAV